MFSTARRLAVPFAALILALFVAAPASAVPIRDLHNVSFTGGLTAPYTLGTPVTVTGVVVSPDNIFSLTADEIVVRDTTGAITVFRSGGGFNYVLGDSVTVSGVMDQFNGLTEIANASIVTNHSSGNFAFYNDPILRTCKQVRDSTMNFQTVREDLESQLIRINNVTVVGGAWPTTCTGLNATLTIQDATGTTTLFLDKDSPLCGSSNPSGAFDVIGILTQFDTSGSLFDGYQIKPRFLSDVIPLVPGPNFIGVPIGQATDSTSATVTWATDVPSTSIVNYGLTPALGSTAGDSTATANHVVNLTGLQPNRLYYFRVVSCDVNGCRQSDQSTFVTPSGRPGQMNFYFNKSVDISLANPDTANGNVDLRQRLIAYINRATYSLDLALYSFSDPPVTDALIARWNAGVKIRLILDAENGQSQADRLRVIGVPVITSTFGGNHATGIHHNKFVLCDARDASTENDWVWSGSTNCSTDQLLTDPNNAFEIQDYGMTQAFLVEFNEEWGSTTDLPNAPTAMMGSAKLDNTPHFFNVNGIPIEVWFSPSDGTDGKISGYVANTADYGVAYSILAFTSDPIAAAMRAKYESIPGFYVRGVHEVAQASGSGSEYQEMKGIGGANPWSPPADVWVDTEPGLHHHKYLIIDEGRGASDPILLSGSHNWSNAANTVNDENTVVFHSQRIANLYMQEFRARYTAAGGSVNFTVDAPSMPVAGLSFAVPTPNPAPGGRTTAFALAVPAGASSNDRLTLELYSVAGRRIRTLLDRPAVGGPVTVGWDGADDAGRAVPPGVYLARASLAGQHVDRKVVRIP